MFTLILIWKKWSPVFFERGIKVKPQTSWKNSFVPNHMSVVGTKFCHLPEALKAKSKDSLLQNAQTKDKASGGDVMARSFPSHIYCCTAELTDLLPPFTGE